MHVQHDATLTSHAADARSPLAVWLEDAERELQEALDQTRASSQRCLMALTALAQVRAFVESSPVSAPQPATHGSPRILRSLPLARSETGHGKHDTLPAPAPCPAASRCLTQREIEVLIHIAGGRSNKQIALALSLSIRTVERHINNIYRKIDAHNKADATAWALRHNLA